MASSRLARRKALVAISAKRLLKTARRRLALPKASEPRAARLEYTLALKRLVGRLRADVVDILPPGELALHAAPELEGARVDAEGKLTGRLRRRLHQTAREARLEDVARRAGAKVVEHTGLQLSLQLRSVRSRRALALSINALETSPALAGLVDVFATTNAGLVKGLVDDLVDELAELVGGAAVRGLRVEALADEVQTRLDVSESRATLIARDQITKINGEATEVRHREAGITQYTWSTSRDERVRGTPDGKYPDSTPSHWNLEGQVFSWDAPPPAGPNGDPAHPGRAIQCRCTANPVVVDLLGG